MERSFSETVYNLLIKKKIVSQEDLDKAKEIFDKDGGNLGDILVGMNAVSKEDLLAALSEGLGLPLINLSRFRIDPDILKLIPKKLSLSHQILPISRTGKQLTVAMVDPMNIFAMDDLKTITKLTISPVIVSEDDMKEAISKYFERSAAEDISDIVDGIKSEQMEMVSDEEDISSGDLLRITEEAPVVKLTNLIVSHAVNERASDILIEPMENNSRVRYRIDGVLWERYNPPKKFHRALISRLKVMSNLNIAERRLPQDGRFMIKLGDHRVDFRVSIVPSSMGEKAALRILDKEAAMLDLDKLGFKARDNDKIRKASEKPHGMILVCGPTGCGKTTTLYSVLKHVDDPGLNIVTVEDPVEFELKGINQVSINDEIGLTFARCLRSILRQDPDVIMVGEIRDFDTLDIAIKSSLTGHLVLSTLHTNTATGSVVRMINMGVEPFLIASSVELIAAQRLIRRLCHECREEYIPTKEVAEKYGLFDPNGKINKLYRPKGCKRCLDSGYSGRVGIIECMQLSPLIKKKILARAEGADLEDAARREGMTTLRENGIENVLEGTTSLEEVLRTTVDVRQKETK